jgi:hypothetical protein
LPDVPCCLCGEPIPDKPANPENVRTDEHVPPLQFYPKVVATIYHALGYGAETRVTDPLGRPHCIEQGKPVRELF